MTKRVLLWVMVVGVSTMTGWAKPAPKPVPDVPAKAGQITALLPVAKIVRGAGKTAVSNDAKKGDDVVWNDVVKTEKGGRARITLTDQSILSVGSQAELRIVKHDAQSQQTALQVGYGRVRAQVSNITRSGGSFEMRTPTAVAGVIGTDFGVESSPTDGDTFVCLAGATQISNSDPNIPGSVQCSAGQTTTVMPGKAPTTPVPASLQQLQQLIEDTEPAIISSIAPAAAMPGTNFDASVAGSKLGKVSGVRVAGGSGVTASLKSADDSSAVLHIVIDPTASAGPRTLTLVKDQGASSAAVFTVLGTPIGDPKKAYLDTLEQLRTTGIGGLGSFLTGAQQAADQVAQQITSANQSLPHPLDLTPFATSLNQQYSVLSNDLKTGTGSVDKAAQQAANTFAGLYDAAFQALLQRDPSGTPDSTFTTALTAAFTQANTILQNALQSTQTNLNGSVQTYGNQLNSIQQLWSQNISYAFSEQQNGPLPKVNALERIVELGGSTSFDAGSSSAANASSSISSYQWTLCSANYQPQGFGQMLPANAPACNGIQGFVSTSPEFQIATCTLQPGNYHARLAVTDSSNKVSQMDVRLTVLAPNYPTPGGTVRALADAYTSLQLSQFLRLFDAAQFNGYTPLSENIRQTMQSLSSMGINLRLSQENVTCNDATVRADWQQNYSFVGDPAVYSQTEQLSVRMQRAPGKGWFITDFQGDNGKVQGVPGPQTTDVASPDLAIVGTTIDGRPVNPAAPLAVAAGPHTVAVNITNNGSAPLSLGVLLPVVINVQDTNGASVATIDTFNGTVPTPLNAGATTTVMATLNFPTAATNLSMQVQINPSCNPPEKTCGAPNNAQYPLALGLPDFTASFAPTGTVNGIAGRSFALQAVNVVPSSYPASLTIAYSGLPAGLAAGSPAGNTPNISGALIVGTPSATGSSTISATASAAGTTKNVNGSATIAIGAEINVAAHNAPTFVSGGPSQNLVLDVTGGVYPVTIELALPNGFTTTSGTVTNGVARQTLSGPGPITYALTAGNGSTSGNQNFTVVATDPGVPASNTPAGNKTFTFAYTVIGVPDLQVNPFVVNPAQQGASYTESVSVSNVGSATANGGWNVQVLLNAVVIGTAIGPAIPAGQTVTVPVTIVMPSFAAPPQDQVLSGVVEVNGNQAIQEITTSNNTASYTQRVVDFTLTSTPPASTAGVVGRPYAANQVVTLNPNPYPAAVSVSYPTLPPGLAGTGSGGGLSLPNITGTPTTAGTTNLVPSATVDGVTHAAGTQIAITINPEISLTQTATPALTAGGAAQNLSVSVTGGIYPVTLALTLPTGITTTSGTVNGGISTLTLSGPGTATWSVTADFTAAAGGLETNIVATDGGNPLTSTPAGNVILAAKYSVNGSASYSITGFTVAGHTTPFTEANAFQVGETTQFQVSVKNNGNSSPSGNVTVALDCGNSNLCPEPLTVSGAAPAAGATTVINVPLDFSSFAVESYSGSLALTTDVAGAGVTGSPVSVPFDVVDFTIGGASLSPFQNLPINGTAELGVSVALQRPSGNPFGISITPAPEDSALVFNPSTKVTAGAQILFPVTIGSTAIPGQGTVRFNATNHGVTKFVDIPYVAFTANLTSTTLFVNDFANPLQVPVAVGASAPNKYPRIEFKLNGNFDHTSGPAAIFVQQPGCGTFSAAIFPSTAVPGDMLDLPIYASSGNNCPAGTQLAVNAAIPQTFPVLTLPVYTLYVTPSGLPQLAIQSATPARDLSSQPWLSGEPLDWTVVVQNTGSGASAGNERVTIYANGAEVGQATVPTAIPAGQTASINVHTVAPDYPEAREVSSVLNLRVNVQSDTLGDLSPGSGNLYSIVNFSNWGIDIISGEGASDETPVELSPTTTSGQVEVAIKDQATFNPNLSVALVPGSYSSGQLSAPGFSPNSITNASSSFVTVGFNGQTSPVNGSYFVQVIAQMKDGGTVTAQRQVTIHVRMNGQSKTPAGITLSSDRSNIGPLNECVGCQTVQINGPLPESFTLTASVNSCSAGNGCPGTADITFTDTYMTATTPQVTTVNVTSPGNTLPVVVKAAENPDGSINTGSAKVNVSITAIQASFYGSARTPTPDPVGNYQFEMNFNIADMDVLSSSCLGIPPQSPTPVQVYVNWSPSNGFNVPTISWEWQDANHVPVGGSPLAFDTSSGTSTYTGNGYSAPPPFNITNPTAGVDGLQTYYFAITVSNGTATATKYFPFDFDLSRSQTFCPAVRQQRGAAGGTVIRGSWGKAGLSAPKIATMNSARTAAAPATGQLPDLRINANDISFTPSIPKQGDTVAVRFRISNVGDADAAGVPVALQVGGTTVVSDTFDIPAGKTVLGGLQWANAHTAGAASDGSAKSDAVASRRALRMARLNIDSAETGDPTPRAGSGGRLGLMQAQIVIDPQKTIAQKSTLAKAAPLAHFGVRNSNADMLADANISEQRVLLEIPEGGCGGLKFTVGAGTCTSADVTFTVEDLAKASYKLESFNGIADLGMGNRSTVNASYGMQAVGQNGHTYAVQLNGGNTGIVTVTAVRNPEQLSEAAKRLFRQGRAIKIVKSLGGTTDAAETGDTASGGSQPMVYFEIVYQGQ